MRQETIGHPAQQISPVAAGEKRTLFRSFRRRPETKPPPAEEELLRREASHHVYTPVEEAAIKPWYSWSPRFARKEEAEPARKPAPEKQAAPKAAPKTTPASQARAAPATKSTPAAKPGQKSPLGPKPRRPSPFPGSGLPGDEET
jgi:hypothetical protein